ncbi:MAG: S9 family peptidase [Bacteroidetes bacterium]|jgi:dipeptidyl-peptidase 4|nr:S9 family peptidase [Bacteroidota bacterium]MBT6686596.1 S9 family peptidase [Bacteroidota bacterium]MBT7141918.1 S9 family peptidase [Bacteroidota bacterium]MBT7490663.1 S9 family peptidase [Bacteroidota bacterium]
MKFLNKLLIVIAVFAIANPLFSQTDTKKISLEDLWKNYTFYPRSVYGLRSTNDGENYTVLNKGINILKISYKTGDTLLNFTDTSTFYDNGIKRISDYSFNETETKILLTSKKEAIYRHSFSASYFVFDIETKNIIPLSENGKQQLATFSPDGSKIAFVRDNNLFVMNLAKLEEIQITTDGKYNEIINGAPDWVYEEEFAFSKAFVWSPNGDRLAYYKFNESEVKQFNMTTYGELYPEWYRFKYPKAGEDNAIVSINVFDFNTKKSIVADIGTETDQYVPRIKWTKDNDIFAIYKMNRLQNKLEILLANAKNGSTQIILTEEDEKYVDEVKDNTVIFLNDKKHFIYSSEKSGFYHLYLYDLNGNLVNQITQGEWDVTDFNGYDTKSKRVFFTSAEDSPLQRKVCSIKLNGKSKKDISQKIGTNKAVFSKNFKYFINYYSNANSPTYVSLHNSSGKFVRELKNNNSLIEKMTDYGFSKKEFFSFKTSENVELNAWMIKPSDFDENKKYPVFFTIYGGPGSQTVTDSWDGNMGWYQMLAQNGYIVVSLDNRGTGARGEEFKKITYEQLGKYETIDQIEFAKYLRRKSFVDPDRIGVFGWSYGGYMSTLCLTKGAAFFKMAIAVAPVTNWRFYDSIYTERYMGLPKNNAEGYDDNSPINHVEKMKGKFLLVHGTGDDNVHFQNSMELASKLIEANIQFEEQFYPNKNHGIYGGNTRLHLYTKMTNFIFDNL